MKQKEIIKLGEDILDKKEFAIVRDMFNKRLFGIQRIQNSKKTNKWIFNKTKEKSMSNQNDVYSKIQAIGLGKVIYIRKK